MGSEDKKKALEAIGSNGDSKMKKKRKGEEEEDKANVLPPVPATQMVCTVCLVAAHSGLCTIYARPEKNKRFPQVLKYDWEATSLPLIVMHRP